MEKIDVRTHARDELVDVTSEIQRIIQEKGVEKGIVTCFVPHTTAGITINENADPDVQRDLLYILDQTIPHENGYHHFEGNAAAHMKASMMGFSQQLLVEQGALVLGRWQGVYFCEFDGPRNRQMIIALHPDLD